MKCKTSLEHQNPNYSATRDILNYIYDITHKRPPFNNKELFSVRAIEIFFRHDSSLESLQHKSHWTWKISLFSVALRRTSVGFGYFDFSWGTTNCFFPFSTGNSEINFLYELIETLREIFSFQSNIQRKTLEIFLERDVGYARCEVLMGCCVICVMVLLAFPSPLSPKRITYVITQVVKLHSFVIHWDHRHFQKFPKHTPVTLLPNKSRPRI